ncbi:hypothetical protein DW66_2717 [Pseudomonas putida]|nr:hypothetical protein DW66_2717 [Pseudomonas putida]
MDIDLGARQGDVHCFNTQTKQEIAEVFDLSDPEHLQSLIDLISKAAKGEI